MPPCCRCLLLLFFLLSSFVFCSALLTEGYFTNLYPFSLSFSFFSPAVVFYRRVYVFFFVCVSFLRIQLLELLFNTIKLAAFFSALLVSSKRSFFFSIEPNSLVFCSFCCFVCFSLFSRYSCAVLCCLVCTVLPRSLALSTLPKVRWRTLVEISFTSFHLFSLWTLLRFSPFSFFVFL